MQTVNQMASVLANSKIDLSNEITAMMELVKAKFTSVEILSNLQDAMKLARDKRHHREFYKFVGVLFGRTACQS